MASPPFTPNEAVPADSDFASQFPAAERTFRDVIESWLLFNHNTSGRHDKVDLDYKADPSGVASVGTIWVDTNGIPRIRFGSGGSVEPFGVPVGTILDYAGSTAPNGYLFCYGQAVSRTTYANLFTVLSTVYGAGDLSTTFNLPDLRGRVVAGQDDMGGSSANRLTDQSGGLDGDTLGDTGGVETHTLTANESAVLIYSSPVTDPGHAHVETTHSGGGAVNVPQNTTAAGAVATGASTSPAETGITVATTANAGGAAHNNVQPTIILNKIIKV